MSCTLRWNFDDSGAVHTTVTGTAWDTFGNSYVFNYRNNYKGDPLNGPGHMTDHFNLVGNGSGAKLQEGFNLFVVTFDLYTLKERGGSLTLGCDPI